MNTINQIPQKSICTLLVVVMLAALNSGCQSKETSNWQSFGESITLDQSVSTPELVNRVSSSDSIKVKFEGEIDQVCQMKGCWMTLKTEDGSSLRVTFKNYGFFVPKDASGKKVVVEGMAILDDLDEETARHYAEDAGQLYVEGSGTRELSVVASGVLIEKTRDQL